jgi:hypothetical protein
LDPTLNRRERSPCYRDACAEDPDRRIPTVSALLADLSARAGSDDYGLVTAAETLDDDEDG